MFTLCVGWMKRWWSFSKGMCAGAQICNVHTHTHKSTYCGLTRIQTCTPSHQKPAHHPNPQPPKRNICVHHLLKLSRCISSCKSELVFKSGPDDRAWCQSTYHRKGLFIKQMGIKDLLANVTIRLLLSVIQLWKPSYLFDPVCWCFNVKHIWC